MKAWIAVGIAAGIGAAAGNLLVDSLLTNSQTVDVYQLFNNELKRNEKRLKLNQEVQPTPAPLKTTRVFVKGKPVKECMKEIGTNNEINNEVIACNTGYWLELQEMNE